MLNKKDNSILFLVLGIVLAVIGVILTALLIIQYGPKRSPATVSEELIELFQTTPSHTATQALQHISNSTPISPSATPSDLPTPSQTPEWMVYEAIDLRDQPIDALLTMRCNDDQVYLPPFNVVPYSPELIDSGIFYSVLNFSIAWEHLGFYGLWVHSGQTQTLESLPAYPLQLYLENDARGYRRTQDDFQQHLQACLLGAELRLRQEGTISINEVVAAVRIPPTAVDEVSRHPMDLVPYLAENFPDSGFDQMQVPGLIFYFCGRQLTAEAYNSELDYWTQSRIIIGFMPAGLE